MQYPANLQSDVPTALEVVQDTGYTQGASFDVNGGPTNTSAATAWDKHNNPITLAAAEADMHDSLIVSWTPMIYSPGHTSRAVAIVQCGDDGILASAVDCLLNGKVQTAAW